MLDCNDALKIISRLLDKGGTQPHRREEGGGGAEEKELEAVMGRRPTGV